MASFNTTEAAVRELEHLAIGQDPRRIMAPAQAAARQRLARCGHIHRTAIAAIETACLGHSWQVAGRADPSVARRPGARQRARLCQWLVPDRADAGGFPGRRPSRAGEGFHALKLDPFGTAQGFIDDAELISAYDIVRGLRDGLGPHIDILIDVHARFTEAEAAPRRATLRRSGHLLVGRTDRPRPAGSRASVAAQSPIRVATGEMYDTVGQFYTLAERGGVNIFQPEPMSLGGIANTLAVANLALAHGSYIAPHQSAAPSPPPSACNSPPACRIS